jgi:hypothetical protein
MRAPTLFHAGLLSMSFDAIGFWVNIAAMSSGMMGTVLIQFFGVPRQIDTGGADYICTEQTNEDEKRRIRSFKRWSNVGLGLVFFAFLLQLLALIVANYAQ